MGRSSVSPPPQAGAARGLITLTTDFGCDGTFVGVMKGVIAGINPFARVIDLTHSLPPFDTVEAALWLKGSYSFFPKGTVHVVVVDPGVGSARRIVAAGVEDHLFLAPDNGILDPILKKTSRGKVVAVTNKDYFLPNVSRTFHGRDIFAPVAAHLSLGVPLDKLGPPARLRGKLNLPEPRRTRDGGIVGEVVLCDRFGNLITNIPEGMLQGVGLTATLRVRIGKRSVFALCGSYSDVPRGEWVAVVGSLGTLELACSQANARELLGAGKGDAVCVMRRGRDKHNGSNPTRRPRTNRSVVGGPSSS
jgi:hypothetical protein